MNKENDEKMPKGLLGAGGLNSPSLSRTASPASRYETRLQKAKTVSPKIMPPEGFTDASKLCP